MYFIDNEGGKTVQFGEVLTTCSSTMSEHIHPFSSIFSAASSHFYLLKIVTVEEHISSKPQSMRKHSCCVLQSYSHLNNMLE